MFRKREIMAGLFVLVSTYPEVSHANKHRCIRDCLEQTQGCYHACYERYPDDLKAAEVCSNQCMGTGAKCVQVCDDRYGKDTMDKEGLTNKEEPLNKEDLTKIK